MLDAPQNAHAPALPTIELPGPKRKAAEALAQNIGFMCKTWGTDRVGFLTLTCGDLPADEGELFCKVHDRREAGRRFNSLLSNLIKRRYRCGVVVTERHKDGGIHFHLVIVTEADIRTGVDFEACFPKCKAGKYERRPDYRTAPEALREEWKFWRDRAPAYGFGRCRLEPVKSNAEGLGRYVGKYISKSWTARHPQDKGGRCIRYFGDWNPRREFKPADPKGAPRARAKLRRVLELPKASRPRHRNCQACWRKIREPLAGNFKDSPRKAPWSANHGSLSPRARAWRECCKQITLSSRLQGRPIVEADARAVGGRRWAWKWTGLIRRTQFFPRGDKTLVEAMKRHNDEVTDLAQETGRPATAIWEEAPGFWFTNSTETDPAAPIVLPENPAKARAARDLQEAADEIMSQLTTATVFAQCPP